MLRVTGYLLLVVSCLLLVSCARTVTPLVDYGDEMRVEVTLRGPANTSANRYFLIVSSEANYAIPLPAPNINELSPELLEPGTIPQQGSAEAYYTNYYSSWAGYILLDNTMQYNLVAGPFIINQSITHEIVARLNETSATLSFSFRLARLFPVTVPDKIYFDFVSVAWPDGQLKIPADHLPSTSNYISKISGSLQTIPDQTDSNLAAGLDILNCKVVIQ